MRRALTLAADGAHRSGMPPPIRYVRNGDVNIAYQVVGEGPPDLLLIPGWISHLALDWEEPTWVRWCERMRRTLGGIARFSGKRPGFGLFAIARPRLRRAADRDCDLVHTPGNFSRESREK